MMKWISTEPATLEKSKDLLDNRISDLPMGSLVSDL